MTRDEWRARSGAFEASARTLLDAAQYDIAYYLAGIAVECALKAKIARRFRANDIPDRKLVADIYQNGHDLTGLVRYAQLENELMSEQASSPAFRDSWLAVTGWNVNARYQQWSQQEAVAIFSAVSQRGSGVLPWIRRHW